MLHPWLNNVLMPKKKDDPAVARMMNKALSI